MAGAILLLAGGVAYYALRDNFSVVIPDEFFRSAYLSPERLKEVVLENDIRTVVSLRPIRENADWHEEEATAIDELGVKHLTVGMSQAAPRVDNIFRLKEALQEAQRPVLVSCASGVDRTGLASAMALLMQGDQGLAQIQEQVSWRHGAINDDSIGKVFLTQYQDWLDEKNQAHSPTVFEDWLENDYIDPTGNVHFLIHPIHGKTWERPYGKGERFTISRSETPVLELEGWAFDTRNESALAGISASLDDEALAKAEYGLHFPWLKEHFSNPEYLDSGWTVRQSLYDIADGCQDLKLTFMRLDGSSWQTPTAARICITE